MVFLLLIFMSKEKQPLKEEKLRRYQLERRFLIIGLFSGFLLFNKKPVSVGIPIKGVLSGIKGIFSIVWRILKWKNS